MLKTTFVLFGLLVVLTACSSNPKPLKAPCTYSQRSDCGPIVPMQQRVNMAVNPVTQAVL